LQKPTIVEKKLHEGAKKQHFSKFGFKLMLNVFNQILKIVNLRSVDGSLTFKSGL